MPFVTAPVVPTTPFLDHPDDAFFDQLIATDFARLRTGNHHYLDYTGGGLYAERQLQTHFRQLSEGTFGNPHSVNPTSRAATESVEAARSKVLEFFNAADDYYCVFTANATAALKIVGECFPWNADSRYLLLTDNHNSVNGIREYCRSAGGAFEYAPVCSHNLTIDGEAMNRLLDQPTHGPSLFAYPAQSNVSGVKHDLGWVETARSKGWYTLLDAAAFVPTNPLDLQEVTPDFVCLSFYKMFGYPTGIGALLLRKPALSCLKKRWFAGGNVRIAGVRKAAHLFNENHEQFENGTVNYLGLPAVETGLDFLGYVGMERLRDRVRRMAGYLHQQLRELRHANGNPLVRIYGPRDRSSCGGTIIFTVFDERGKRRCFREVEARTAEHRVSVRSGCFCNPGLDEINSEVSPEELEQHFTIAGGMNHAEIMASLSAIRGATRASVGIATTTRDIDVLIEVLASFRVESLR